MAQKQKDLEACEETMNLCEREIIMGIYICK